MFEWGIDMSCQDHEVTCCAIDCGIAGKTVQDCVESQWVVFNQTPLTIYLTEEFVSGSGTVEVVSATPDLTELTITFSLYGSEVTHFTLANKQSLSFTVVGFDTIALQGNATDPLESAAGRFFLAIRYQIF